MQNYLFIRRCHVCDNYMESSEEILQCENEKCKKFFLPFFYFDKRRLQENSDVRIRTLLQDPLEFELGQGPVVGLTAYWEQLE